MRRDHDGVRLNLREVLGDGDALRMQAAEDGGVVHEVAEDSQGTGVSMGVGELDCIADAEAHAKMGGAQYSHTLRFKVYCELNHVKFGSRFGY